MRTAAAIAAVLLALLPPAAAAQEDPEAVYAKFHRALQAGDLAMMTRYGSAAGGKEMAAMPPEQSKAMLEMMKKLVPQNYSITGKVVSPDGNTATLHASGKAASMFGGGQETQYAAIRLLKQGGQWKVDESSWSNKPPPGGGTAAPAGAPAPPPKAAMAPAARSAAPKPQPERPLGAAKAPCVYKPVMTNQDIENCR